jgi:hypothetical protein
MFFFCIGAVFRIQRVFFEIGSHNLLFLKHDLYIRMIRAFTDSKTPIHTVY